MDLEDLLAKDEAKQAGQTNPPVPTALPAIPPVDARHGRDRSGKKNLSYREIEPARCRCWKYHNRSDSWLSRPEQQSLAQSIERDGQQQLGLVRVVEHDPDIDHEIIFGHRRSEACKAKGIKFKARVLPADTPDAVCMQYMHVENKESHDVSELEDAQTYKALLDDGVYKHQTELAISLSITQGYLSRLLSTTVIFDYAWLKQLVEPVIMDVSVRTACTLANALKEPNTLRNMRNAAHRIEEQGTTVPGPQLVKALLGGTNRNTEKKKHKKVLVKQGRNNRVTLNHDDTGNVVLTINAYERSKEESAALLQQIHEALKGLL